MACVSNALSRDYSDVQALVAAVQANDQDATGALYDRLHSGIRFLLVRQVGSDAAEDLTNDLCLALTEQIRAGKLRDAAAVYAYATTIARRMAAEHIRQRVATKQRGEGSLEADCVADNSETPEQKAIRAERMDIARRALSDVSVQDREVLMRFYVYEHRPEQICAEMNLTETQFRLLIYRP